MRPYLLPLKVGSLRYKTSSLVTLTAGTKNAGVFCTKSFAGRHSTTLPRGRPLGSPGSPGGAATLHKKHHLRKSTQER